MKVIYLFCLLLGSYGMFAQAPEGFNFSGSFLSNGIRVKGDRLLNVRSTILEKSNVVYVEEHDNVKAKDGNFSITIGSGNPTLGVFSGIDWANGTYYLNTQIRILPKSRYIDLGTTQFLSVPYALLASSTNAWTSLNNNIVFSKNKVGINTESPEANLDVNGEISANVLEVKGTGGSDEMVLVVNGYTRTKVLEITGGSDITERFRSKTKLEPGDVVVIDRENPGFIKKSDQKYDQGVIGVVSGANGVKPGIELSQAGVLEGDQLIAIAGRVYVKATTRNGKISPGDLITSSFLEGYAMKATKKSKSRGTIIGKALLSLEEGEGLILILIQPQ